MRINGDLIEIGNWDKGMGNSLQPIEAGPKPML